MSLTPNGGDSTHLETSKSDKRAIEKNSENTELKFLPLEYTNQTSIMTATEQSAYFICILICTDNKIMHLVTCHLDTGAQPNPISKDLLPTAWISKISKEVRPSFIPASKDQLKTKKNITLPVKIGDLRTIVLFTVVQNLAVYVLLDTTIIDEHIHTILPDQQKVPVRKPTPVAVVKSTMCLLMPSLESIIRKMPT